MYLSRVRLVNWRSYEDATFDFQKPSSRRPLVLIGAMNGHGKTSFLIALYLGLFGKFGLRYCEGFGSFAENDVSSYRKAVALFRRNTSEQGDPTVVELTFTPTLNDTEEEEKEIRVVRRWFFTAGNKPKQGDNFEEVELYRDARPEKTGDLDIIGDRIEKFLFPAHVMPAFFFDGEQAQTLINNSGAPGIKKALEVMFGTKLLDELHDQMQQYITVCRQKMGGKRHASGKDQELHVKCQERDELNRHIAHLQEQESEITDEKDRLETERRGAQDELARLGGAKALDAKRLQDEVLTAEREKAMSEAAMTETARDLGIALAVSRLAPIIQNRLKAEEDRETWERLKTGTLERTTQVLDAAMPEPASRDNLLGHLAPDLRGRVRERFQSALEHIYHPPPSGCASEYILGHAKGEQRQTVFEMLARCRRSCARDIREKARRLNEAQDRHEEATVKFERLSQLPAQVNDLAARISELNRQIDEAIRRLSSIEYEIRKLKSDLHALSKRIGELTEDIARMEPDQKRVAVAERVHRVLDDLPDRLRPIALLHLEEKVTQHFLSIADKRFEGGRIVFPADEEGSPIFEGREGSRQRLDTMSGFERRSFGVAFSLALAEVTHKRIPLVIDTPLGNADSEYRPRLLKALTTVELDQVIILTHDQEVYGDVLQTIDRQVAQKFLVSFDQDRSMSQVQANAFFGGGI